MGGGVGWMGWDGVGWVGLRGVGWGGMGGGKKLQLGHHQSSQSAHTVAHATLVGNRGSGSYVT